MFPSFWSKMAVGDYTALAAVRLKIRIYLEAI